MFPAYSVQYCTSISQHQGFLPSIVPGWGCRVAWMSRDSNTRGDEGPSSDGVSVREVHGHTSPPSTTTTSRLDVVIPTTDTVKTHTMIINTHLLNTIDEYKTSYSNCTFQPIGVVSMLDLTCSGLRRHTHLSGRTYRWLKVYWWSGHERTCIYSPLGRHHGENTCTATHKKTAEWASCGLVMIPWFLLIQAGVLRTDI